jgi:hypothetical protein
MRRFDWVDRRSIDLQVSGCLIGPHLLCKMITPEIQDESNDEGATLNLLY